MAIPAKYSIFRISELPDIKIEQIDKEDSLLISDRRPDNKWESKRLRMDTFSKFLAGDRTMNVMVDNKIVQSAQEGGVIRPVISSAVSSMATIQRWQNFGGVEELSGNSGVFCIHGGDATNF